MADGAAILLILVAVVLLRLTSFVPAVVDTDEGLYMVQAREWLRGGWPLVAAWDMHPIGAPAMFAGTFLLFGVSVEAVRLLGLICVAGAACALFAARAGGGRAARGGGGGRGSPTPPIRCCSAALHQHRIADRALHRHRHGHRHPRRGARDAAGRAGAGLGRAGGDGPAGGWRCWSSRWWHRPAASSSRCWSAGLVARRPAAAARPGHGGRLCRALRRADRADGVVYWVQGWLPQYLDGSLLAPFRYSLERIAPAEAWRRIGAAILPLGLAFGAASVALALWRPRGPMALLTAVAVAWFAMSSLAIAGPGFFFAHYFLLWLPSLSLLAAIGAWRLARAVAQPHLLRAVFAGLVLVLASQGWLPEAAARLERGPGLMHRDPVREVAAAVAEAAGRAAMPSSRTTTPASTSWPMSASRPAFPSRRT
jgi:4-amino-4-deoxy-L-arabinose transferase-like glycosyltransferase